MTDLNRPFRLADWNTLIQQANDKRQEAIDDGCEVPDDPLQEVTSPHRWRRQDIIDMQDFLKVLCDDDSFTEVPDYWPAQSVEEIEAHLANVAPCNCCQIGTEQSYTERDYDLVVFPTASELWDNTHLPLVYETEGNTAAETAYTQWQALDDLLTNGASEAAVSAQVTALNTAAEIGWSYASSAHTGRYNVEPLYQWLTPSSLRTSDPVIQFVEFFGTTYRQWVWCRSYVVVRVEFHRCGFGSYFTYRDDYRFESSPGRLPILKNTYTYDPQSMFCRNHKFACAANFVGSGDCDDVNDCLELLAGAGKKFNVTVEYHTTRAYYPGSPV